MRRDLEDSPPAACPLGWWGRLWRRAGRCPRGGRPIKTSGVAPPPGATPAQKVRSGGLQPHRTGTDDTRFDPFSNDSKVGPVMANDVTDSARSAVATTADLTSLPDGASGTFTPTEAALVRKALRRELLGDYAREVDTWRAECAGTGGSPAAHRARLRAVAGGAS